MNKIFCGVLALALMVAVATRAAEPVGIEVRTRNSIGRLGVVKVNVTMKAEADGSMTVSFQAPNAATYVLNYTSGPDAGKVAATVRAEKPGPVTTKIKPSKH